MKDFIKHVLLLLKRNESFALATIIRLNGSAPRDAGTHMVQHRDGSTYGSVGGGILEAGVREEALRVMAAGTKSMFEFDLSNSPTAADDMACGGRLEILIDYIDAQKKVYQDIYQTIMNSMNAGHPSWLITPLPGRKAEPYGPGLLKASGEIVGTAPAGALAMPEILKQITNFTVLDALQVTVEPFAAAETAYVFGAGHIGHKLVPLLNMVGFETVVIDDRADYANRERFAVASRVIVGDMPDIFSQIKTDSQSYIVIATRGHAHDQQLLARALNGPAAYIGMIGSESKRKAAYSCLLRNGYALRDLERVYSPIGLRIQAETPEEIAVSIAAEMIAVRAKGRIKSHRCPC